MRFGKLIALFLILGGVIASAQDQMLSKEDAILLALDQNFGILVANNNVEIADNNQSVLNSGYLPILSANAGATYNRDDSTIEFPGRTDDNGDPFPDVEIEKAEAQRYNTGLNLNYTLFDGFVVLHGTDTLAYTSSALSFMLENLGKPVIVTGSQIPCFETRSDGRDNFVGALILAGMFQYRFYSDN